MPTHHEEHPKSEADPAEEIVAAEGDRHIHDQF